MLCFLFLLLTWLLQQSTFCITQIQQQVTLNAINSSLNGASILSNPNSVTNSFSKWNITVQPEQNEYDLKLLLNNSWGFRSNIISIITIIIDGISPQPLNVDKDLLLVFSVNNLQYFSIFIHLDDRTFAYKICHFLSKLL